MTRTPTPAELTAIRTGYTALRESQSPTSNIVEQVVFALGTAELLRAVCPPPRPMIVHPPALALTNREHEVVLCAAIGLSVETTAARLAIAEDTVRTHRAHALAKVGARTMAQAVARSICLGLLTMAQIKAGGRP